MSEQPRPGRSGQTTLRVPGERLDVAHPVPPRSGAAMQQHQRDAVAPDVPHHAPDAARRVMTDRGALHPVEKALRIGNDGPPVRAACDVLWCADRMNRRATASSEGKQSGDDLHQRTMVARRRRTARDWLLACRGNDAGDRADHPDRDHRHPIADFRGDIVRECRALREADRTDLRRGRSDPVARFGHHRYRRWRRGIRTGWWSIPPTS